MHQLDDHLRRRLLEMIYFLRGCGVRHLTVNPSEGVIWADGHTIRLEELRKTPDPNVAVSSPQRVFAVLYHHKDPTAQPSFISRNLYRPTLEEVKAAVLRRFDKDPDVVGARIYELNQGLLSKVADANRGPAWTYY